MDASPFDHHFGAGARKLVPEHQRAGRAPADRHDRGIAPLPMFAEFVDDCRVSVAVYPRFSNPGAARSTTGSMRSRRTARMR
jgi:hypothetical protein